MLIAAQEYGVTRKLLPGTDYPFAGGPDSIDGLRSINRISGTSGLPTGDRRDDRGHPEPGRVHAARHPVIVPTTEGTRR